MNKIISPYSDNVELVFDKVWYIKNKEHNYDIENNKFNINMMLFPFLMKDEKEYFQLLESDIAVKSFPYIVIIRAGFLQNTKFWTERAISWLYEKEITDWNTFKDFIENVSCDKNYDQKIRQKAIKMLREIER